jgi:hypothetical protein
VRLTHRSVKMPPRLPRAVPRSLLLTARQLNPCQREPTAPEVVGLHVTPQHFLVHLQRTHRRFARSRHLLHVEVYLRSHKMNICHSPLVLSLRGEDREGRVGMLYRIRKIPTRLRQLRAAEI